MSAEPPSRTEAAPVGPALAETTAVWRGTRNDLILASGRQTVAFAAACGLVSMGLMSAVLLHASYPTWRLLTMVGAWATLVVSQYNVVRWVARHKDRMVGASYVMHALAQLYLVTAVAVTGGLQSPMLPALGTASVVPVVFFGTQPATRWLTASMLVLFSLVALMPTSWLGPGLPHNHHVAAAIVSFGWTIAIVTNFITRVLTATQDAACAVDVLNEERVAAAAEHAGRLQAVGAKVAHELKNPLASVKGLVQLVSRSPDAPRTKERLEVMQAEIARMEAILAEYLSFSRPLEDLRPQVLDLAEVTGSAIAAVAGRMESGRISLQVESRHTPIEGDPRRLKEALLNLLSNAVEATPAGGQIRVSVNPAIGSDGAIVEVHDSGRGIKPEDLQRLGTSYFTTRDGGTGLGVVLAQTVVAQHGGSMHYASEPGRGTTVTIRLPARPAAASSAADVLTTSSSSRIEPAA
ncbi:MAG TPA: HAMP domain-containing sensor histidine kinase [Kofleriaceae bacterium]|nr:HAMP domain-containing sensor histidine kinase [Kofleriaceae bacterium]